MSASEKEFEIILQEYVERRARGESPSREEYLQRYPHLSEELKEYFSTIESLDRYVQGQEERPPAKPVFGDFQILREIGSGGMGVVFLAEQLSLRRLVALKLLRAPLAQSYKTVERFRREAEIAARFHHPNIVSVYLVGEREGYCFFAMEYVEGVTLARLLVRLRETGVEQLSEVDIQRTIGDFLGPQEKEDVPPPEPQRPLSYFGAVARMIAEIADSLAYAHARGVIHRDVKPSNILVNRQIVPQLADFGVAKDVGLPNLSIPGDLLGTPYYMSPELAMAGRITVDHRTDVYSLGVTLFEMLTLAVPFAGKSSAEVLRKIMLEPTPPPRRFNPRIPRDLQIIAMRAMEKDPTHRYEGAADMAEDLRRYLRYEPIHATAPGFLRVAGRYVKRHRAAAVVLAVLSLAGFGTTAAVVHAVRRAQLQEAIEQARERESTDQPNYPFTLPSARDAWRAIETRFGRDVPEVKDGLERTERSIEHEVSSFIARGESEMKAVGQGGLHYFMAEDAFDGALRLRPDDSTIRARRDEAGGLFPVDIRSNPDGATITIHPIETTTGQILAPESFGVTPRVGVALRVGWYWVVIEKAGFGFGELALEVKRGESSRMLVVDLKPTDEVTRDMILIPRGAYRTGSNAGDVNERDAMGRFFEKPEVVVEVSEYYIDASEVSNEEYARFVLATNHPPPSHWAASGNTFAAGLERYPVVNVSWGDARAYAEWAGKRLPLEIEWEIACRGANGLIYAWGDAFDPSRAILGTTPPDPGHPGVRTRPVDSMEAGRSPFGLFHMVGNVQEWVWDPWSPREGVVRKDPRYEPRGQRVVRGSSFEDTTAEECRCSARGALYPNFPKPNTGFRCAKSVRP